MNQEITNRVASSTLVTIDLEELAPRDERVQYDMARNLYQETILKEKEFRSFIGSYDWSQFRGKNVAINCSVEAIIPTWAYMLLASKISPYANLVVFGTLDHLESLLYDQAIDQINFDEFRDKKIVIKGCSNKIIPSSAYVTLINKLMPVASSIMYGEPCSTVPIFKKSRE